MREKLRLVGTLFALALAHSAVLYGLPWAYGALAGAWGEETQAVARRVVEIAYSLPVAALGVAYALLLCTLAIELCDRTDQSVRRDKTTPAPRHDR